MDWWELLSDPLSQNLDAFDDLLRRGDFEPGAERHLWAEVSRVGGDKPVGRRPCTARLAALAATSRRVRGRLLQPDARAYGWRASMPGIGAK
jgi:hypothetical protein